MLSHHKSQNLDLEVVKGVIQGHNLDQVVKIGNFAPDPVVVDHIVEAGPEIAVDTRNHEVAHQDIGDIHHTRGLVPDQGQDVVLTPGAGVEIDTVNISLITTGGEDHLTLLTTDVHEEHTGAHNSTTTVTNTLIVGRISDNI
mgnify:CR=1 FL=1